MTRGPRGQAFGGPAGVRDAAVAPAAGRVAAAVGPAGHNDTTLRPSRCARGYRFFSWSGRYSSNKTTGVGKLAKFIVATGMPPTPDGLLPYPSLDSEVFVVQGMSTFAIERRMVKDPPYQLIAKMKGKVNGIQFGFPRDINPDEAGDGGASDGCLNSCTIIGLTPGANGSIEVQMRKKNTANATASSCGPWIGGWNGVKDAAN